MSATPVTSSWRQAAIQLSARRTDAVRNIQEYFTRALATASRNNGLPLSFSSSSSSQSLNSCLADNRRVASNRSARGKVGLSTSSLSVLHHVPDHRFHISGVPGVPKRDFSAIAQLVDKAAAITPRRIRNKDAVEKVTTMRPTVERMRNTIRPTLSQMSLSEASSRAAMMGLVVTPKAREILGNELLRKLLLSYIMDAIDLVYVGERRSEFVMIKDDASIVWKGEPGGKALPAPLPFHSVTHKLLLQAYQRHLDNAPALKILGDRIDIGDISLAYVAEVFGLKGAGEAKSAFKFTAPGEEAEHSCFLHAVDQAVISLAKDWDIFFNDAKLGRRVRDSLDVLLEIICKGARNFGEKELQEVAGGVFPIAILPEIFKLTVRNYPAIGVRIANRVKAGWSPSLRRQHCEACAVGGMKLMEQELVEEPPMGTPVPRPRSVIRGPDTPTDASSIMEIPTHEDLMETANRKLYLRKYLLQQIYEMGAQEYKSISNSLGLNLDEYQLSEEAEQCLHYEFARDSVCLLFLNFSRFERDAESDLDKWERIEDIVQWGSKIDDPESLFRRVLSCHVDYYHALAQEIPLISGDVGRRFFRPASLSVVRKVFETPGIPDARTPNPEHSCFGNALQATAKELSKTWEVDVRFDGYPVSEVVDLFGSIATKLIQELPHGDHNNAVYRGLEMIVQCQYIRWSGAMRLALVHHVLTKQKALGKPFLEVFKRQWEVSRPTCSGCQSGRVGRQ